MDNQQESLTKEKLIPIPEKPNYFIDKDGNIYSTVRTKIPRKLTPHKHWGRSRNPYERIRLAGSLILVHRVVASVTIGRQLNSQEVVNHKDGNTLNNRIENLEVVSHKENVRHAVENNLYCSGESWYKARGIVKNS